MINPRDRLDRDGEPAARARTETGSLTVGLSATACGLSPHMAPAPLTLSSPPPAVHCQSMKQPRRHEIFHHSCGRQDNAECRDLMTVLSWLTEAWYLADEFLAANRLHLAGDRRRHGLWSAQKSTYITVPFKYSGAPVLLYELPQACKRGEMHVRAARDPNTR